MKKNLANRPKLKFEPWHLYYWEAWNALRYDRTYVIIGGRDRIDAIEQPIPFTAIDTYARRYAIDGSAFDALLRFVSVIDFAYLDIRAEERRQQT